MRRAMVLTALVAVATWTARGAIADSAELHNTTGLAYYYQGNDERAFAEFVSALQKDPSFAQPHFNIGRLFERQKRYDEALRQYKDALQLDSTLSEAREGIDRLTQLLEMQGKAPGPASLPPGGVSPGAVDEQIGYLKKLVSDGQTAEAAKRLVQLKDVAPLNPDLAVVEADLAERSGDFGAAINALERAQKLLPGTAAVSRRLAETLYRAGIYDKALPEAQRAIQLAPNDAGNYYVMGLIQLAREKLSDAYDAFREAARLDPSMVQAKVQADKLAQRLGLYYYNAGLFYFQQQAWTRARDYLKKALAQKNLSPEQSAIAQQYLVIAEFSSARVAEQIRKIQTERAFVAQGEAGKRVLLPETEDQPSSFGPGEFVSFVGWIVAIKNNADSAEIIATREFQEVEQHEQHIRSGEPNEASFRSNSDMRHWFTVLTPQPLPSDPRLAPSSRISVKGRLMEPRTIRNPYNLVYSTDPRPYLVADALEVYRERRDTFQAEEIDAPKGGSGATIHRLLHHDPTDQSTIDVEEGYLGSAQREPFGTPRPFINTPPGLAGPLRLDFLKYSDEEKRNLPEGEQ